MKIELIFLTEKGVDFCLSIKEEGNKVNFAEQKVIDKMYKEQIVCDKPLTINIRSWERCWGVLDILKNNIEKKLNEKLIKEKDYTIRLC